MSPLTGESFLLCLAQIGLVFAGFSGLVLTLRQKSNQAWLPREIAGIKFILEHSFGMTLFALAPFILYYWLQSEHRVWQASNAIIAVFLLFLLVTQMMRIRYAKKMGDSPAFLKELVIFYIIPTGILSIIEITQISNGFLTWFGIGLLYLIIQASVQFRIFLTIYTQTNEKQQTEDIS